MSKDDLKKIVKHTRSKNRGSSALDSVNYPDADQLEVTQDDDSYRAGIESLYSVEANSEHLVNLGKSIKVGEVWAGTSSSGFKGKLKTSARLVLKPFHLVYSFLVAPWVRNQEKFNNENVLTLQRLLNYTKNF